MKSVSSRRVTYLCLFIVLSCSRISSAQDLDTSTITGRVLDQNAAMIPGAQVLATSIRTGGLREATTDEEGRYRLIQLEPGNYVLRVSAIGFAPHNTAELKTVAGQSLQIDFTLYVSGINAETVVVDAGDPPVVDTKRMVVGSTLSAREVGSLPSVSRSILDLIFTLPGVTEEPLSTRDLAEDRNSGSNATPEESGTVALAGAPAYSNNFTIDGMDNNDDRAARERFQPSLEAVEEVQVITNQFSAEYGRASGGRINLRTRGGSSTFRGRAYYFFRDEALDANTFRNNSLGLPRLALQEHDWGFTLSGPARIPAWRQRNATLFFAAFERDKVLDQALIDTLVPVQQNKLFPLPQPTTLMARRLEIAKEPALPGEIAPLIASVSTPFIDTKITARVDHQINEMHNASFVYQQGRLKNLRQFGGGNRLADSLQGTTRSSDALTYSDNLVFSANAVNQARFQFSLLAPAFRARGGEAPVVLITINDSLPTEDPSRRSGTLVAGSSTSGGSNRKELRFQLQDVFSYVSGNHSLKVGVDFHRIRSEFAALSDASGTFNFASAGDFLAGLPSRFRQTFGTTAIQRNAYAGFFVQDEWQIQPQLLLSFGLRYERETIVHDLNNFGPRASIAYRPFESDRFVVRLGGGIFYNRALLRTIDDFTLGKQQLLFDTNALRDPVDGQLMNAGQRRNFIAENLHFPQTLQSTSALVQEFGVLNSQFSRRLDPDLRIPESYQVNFGAEQDLGGGYSLEANWTFTRGIHLWREFNANAPVLPPQYNNFSEFLASRDFPNFVNRSGSRPLYSTTNAGELVRFAFAGANGEFANTVARVIEFGVPVSVVNLNSTTSSTSVDVALAALNSLRPDPTRSEVEQLVSAGNSFYRGLTVELRKRAVAKGGRFAFSFRAGYTLSSLIDDGVVNTSDALRPGDFRAERARSLLDRRHRLVVSSVFDTPTFLGSLQLSSIFRLTSGAPFNISIGGTDRNLDDVGNDRPNFSGDTRLLRWRAPGQPLDLALLNQFSLPAIGQSGNLPRNSGRGPGLFAFDLNVSREFHLAERVSLRPVIEFDNVLNKRVFSFGSEFINFNALSPTSSGEQRQAFMDSFLVASRTMRPRQLRVGLRLDF